MLLELQAELRKVIPGKLSYDVTTCCTLAQLSWLYFTKSAFNELYSHCKVSFVTLNALKDLETQYK